MLEHTFHSEISLEHCSSQWLSLHSFSGGLTLVSVAIYARETMKTSAIKWTGAKGDASRRITERTSRRFAQYKIVLTGSRSMCGTCVIATAAKKKCLPSDTTNPIRRQQTVRWKNRLVVKSRATAVFSLLITTHFALRRYSRTNWVICGAVPILVATARINSCFSYEYVAQVRYWRRIPPQTTHPRFGKF